MILVELDAFWEVWVRQRVKRDDRARGPGGCPCLLPGFGLSTGLPLQESTHAPLAVGPADFHHCHGFRLRVSEVHEPGRVCGEPDPLTGIRRPLSQAASVSASAIYTSSQWALQDLNL